MSNTASAETNGWEIRRDDSLAQVDEHHQVAVSVTAGAYPARDVLVAEGRDEASTAHAWGTASTSDVLPKIVGGVGVGCTP